MLGRYDTVGIDLVAMCVDDVVVTGAEPLFFLDYIACGKLNDNKLYALIKGITKGCQEAGCALIGGETAELPGMYEKDSFDLAGFCVGVVDRAKMIDGRLCRKGDKIIGLASSGLHSNGFSLVRKVFSPEELKGKLGLELMRPTRIYSRAILKILEKIRVKAMAHITGGGLIDNIPRILPSELGAKIQKYSWPLPSIFRKIQDKSRLEEKEMFRTFNMGVGMTLILSPQNAGHAIQLFEKRGYKAWTIGEVIDGAHKVVFQD
jgi:phosphoribosylformylglycinamidine cyclo-ligase